MNHKGVHCEWSRALRPHFHSPTGIRGFLGTVQVHLYRLPLWCAGASTIDQTGFEEADFDYDR